MKNCRHPTHWLISTQVGAPGTVVWDSVDTPGAAYVYRTTDGWASHTEIKLTADDAEDEDGFGGAGNDSGEPCAGLGPSCSFEDT